jgi:hypothetical protein
MKKRFIPVIPQNTAHFFIYNNAESKPHTLAKNEDGSTYSTFANQCVREERKNSTI